MFDVKHPALRSLGTYCRSCEQMDGGNDDSFTQVFSAEKQREDLFLPNMNYILPSVDMLILFSESRLGAHLNMYVATRSNAQYSVRQC
jgi:hypothetical protein